MEKKVLYNKRTFLDLSPDTIDTSSICAYVEKTKLHCSTLWDAGLEITDDDGNKVEIILDSDLDEKDYRNSVTKLTILRNTINDLLDTIIIARKEYLKDCIDKSQK